MYPKLLLLVAAPPSVEFIEFAHSVQRTQLHTLANNSKCICAWISLLAMFSPSFASRFSFRFGGVGSTGNATQPFCDRFLWNKVLYFCTRSESGKIPEKRMEIVIYIPFAFERGSQIKMQSKIVNNAQSNKTRNKSCAKIGFSIFICSDGSHGNRGRTVTMRIFENANGIRSTSSTDKNDKIAHSAYKMQHRNRVTCIWSLLLWRRCRTRTNVFVKVILWKMHPYFVESIVLINMNRHDLTELSPASAKIPTARFNWWQFSQMPENWDRFYSLILTSF